MAPTALIPLRFRPILKRLLWGGRRLGTVLGKEIGPETDFAESWELAHHDHGISEIAEGPFQGMTLGDLVRDHADEILGPYCEGMVQFPLLVKFIDAQKDLSVQVHPDDELGRLLAGDNGKTEAWVVLHAEPGSLIYAGLKEGIDRERFARAIETGTVAETLHSFEAKAGDAVFIPSGTVHAIGAGVLLVEVQQMSDTTFRVYDWDRIDAEGRPRMLHLDEAMQSIDFESGPVQPVRTDGDLPREILATCPYFAIERLHLRSTTEVGQNDRFTILIGMEGTSSIYAAGTVTRLDAGETLLLPAALGACEIKPVDGSDAVVLACTIP